MSCVSAGFLVFKVSMLEHVKVIICLEDVGARVLTALVSMFSSILKISCRKQRKDPPKTWFLPTDRREKGD